jgi:hypothetical protein
MMPLKEPSRSRGRYNQTVNGRLVFGRGCAYVMQEIALWFL